MEEHSPYFNYITWKQMTEISLSVTENGIANDMLFTLKLLSIIYSVEEDTLKDMKMSDIMRLRNAVEKGTPSDVKKEKKWVISYIKDKYEVDRFELMDL